MDDEASKFTNKLKEMRDDIMNKLNRNETVVLQWVSDNSYDVKNTSGENLLSSNDNFEMYLADAIFKPNGEIVARYLGANFDLLLDGYVRNVEFDGNSWSLLDSTKNKVSRANMIGVKNNADTIVIIKSEKDDVNE